MSLVHLTARTHRRGLRAAEGTGLPDFHGAKGSGALIAVHEASLVPFHSTREPVCLNVAADQVVSGES